MQCCQTIYLYLRFLVIGTVYVKKKSKEVSVYGRVYSIAKTHDKICIPCLCVDNNMASCLT